MHTKLNQKQIIYKKENISDIKEIRSKKKQYKTYMYTFLIVSKTPL